MVLSQSHEGEQMTTDHVPPHNQGDAEGELTETHPLSPHTQEDDFVLTEEKLMPAQVTITEHRRWKAV